MQDASQFLNNLSMVNYVFIFHLSTSCKLYISICTFVYMTLYICTDNVVLSCYLNSSKSLLFSILCLPINVCHFTDLDAPVIKLSHATSNIIEGDNVIMNCNATGNPDPFYQWYYHNSFIHNSSQLSIVNIKIHNGGRYICKALSGNIEKISSVSFIVQCKF